MIILHLKRVVTMGNHLGWFNIVNRTRPQRPFFRKTRGTRAVMAEVTS